MIRVGITEKHGISKEISQNPPEGVEYIFLTPTTHYTDGLITSTAKGVLKYYESKEIDIIEAPLFPILTKHKWIYTPADFATSMNFGFFHLPVTRTLRSLFLKRIFSKPNFKKLIFKSHAGLNTMKTYGRVSNDFLSNKIEVVYPSVRRVDDHFIKFNRDRVNILFVGEIMAKGGIHVVDAFEKLQRNVPNIYLRMCSPTYFNSKNTKLINKYMERITSNQQIKIGLVDREILMTEILPDTDIFVCPTYRDSYGFAIEEAMAYGIPIVSSNHFAIPEIVEHGVNGFLIDIEQFEFIKRFKNYRVDNLPKDFHDYMSFNVHEYLRNLVSSYDLRKVMGLAGLELARTRFSFERRNIIMKKIYESALS